MLGLGFKIFHMHVPWLDPPLIFLSLFLLIGFSFSFLIHYFLYF